MNDINELFYELIRISIGTQVTLSRQPSADEWKELYAMAKKQSLVGICFAGVQKLYVFDNPESTFDSLEATKNPESITKNLSELQYLRWMGVAAKIQQQNETVNGQCAELQERLARDGYRSCVLKGQSVAQLYGELAAMRHSGDIDTWMMAEAKVVIEWARKTGQMFYYDYHHADISVFKDTEVELHYRPSLSRNLMRNARLQKWFRREGAKHVVEKEGVGFSMPDYLFHVLLTMNHNFWHLLYEGVGFRQVMDLYFVLRSLPSANANGRELSANTPAPLSTGLPVRVSSGKQQAMELLNRMKLKRFTSASMWIMKEVLGLEYEYLLCKPNEKLGRHLLDEIMQAGNFGKHDERLKNGRYDSRWKLMWVWLKHNFRLFGDYPADVLWTPIGILRISLWRRWHYRKENELKNI